MAFVLRQLKILLGFVIFVGLVYAFVGLYPYIFARTVEGIVASVERVEVNVSLMQTGEKTVGLNPELYSFAVAIKEKSGEIVTASAEDRQWAAAKQGQCAVAKYFPYEPWILSKAGTYHKARLIKLYECPATSGGE